MMLRSLVRFTFLFLVLLVFSHQVNISHAQDVDATLEKERVTADRFLQVLQKRPRPGTALDRVYGYHVQNGSLDEFVESLDVPDNEPAAGQQQMILGLLQSQRGRQSLAVTAFEKAEVLMPDDAVCSYYLGKSLLAVGQTEKAAAAMERAIDRSPVRNEALPIFTDLGRIYGRAGQSEKALGVWKKLEALFPGDAKVGGQIASTLAEEGNVDEALLRYDALAKATQKEEDKIAFAVQAAEMRRRLGKTQEATKSLEEILSRLRPGSWLYSDVRNRIEDGFLKSGDFDSLAKYYQDKLTKTPDDLALQVRLGRILVTAGRLDDAKTTLEQAVQRAPEDANVRLALIDVLANKADMQGAAKQYEALAEQDPENPDYLLRWGQVLLEDEKQELESRREAAATVWNRLANARRDDAVTLSQIADRMRSIDRNDDAVALYQKSIDVDPTSPQYREYLGEFLHEMDRKDEAIEVWESIAEGDRRNRDSLVRLAEVFGAFDQGERALQAWRDASEFDLTFPEELRFAKALRGAKLYDEALARLEVAAKITETADEQEQLLKDRIVTFQEAGTLTQKIAELQNSEPTATNLRQLALMHSAAGQLTDAASAIEKAVAAEPDNVDVLIVSADIAERQNRFSDAANLFQTLSKVDTRFRTNYLQRVADLQMRLGQVDDALATCESLIDANPASPDSYQFLARQAFQAGRDDQAITALRRAMSVAPRDNAPRRMLASSFAERYRTDEAIELYWQAMLYETKTDDRIALIEELAPLYDRKSEMETLISRIEEMGREEGDTRANQLMIAVAHESVQDYGAARQAIDRILQQQPRDIALLETMVRLCDKADEVVLAAEFQERIVGLADTPENRFKLVQFQLDGELIDVKTALNERISLTSDPVRLGSMLRSSVARGDLPTATAICRESIRRDSSLWDVKLFLAEMLLLDKSEQKLERQQEALAILDEIRSAEFLADAFPPTTKPVKPQAGFPANFYTSPQYWAQSNFEIQRQYRLGRYASASYSSLSAQTRLVEPRSFAHAQIIAGMLKMVAIAMNEPSQDQQVVMEKVRRKEFPIPPLDQITDAKVLWEYQSFRSLASSVNTTTNVPTNLALTSKTKGDESGESPWPNDEDVEWKMAELDPVNGSGGLTARLFKRVVAASTPKTPDDENKNEPNANQPVGSADESKPLTTKELELLVDLYEKAKAKANQSKSPSVTGFWNLTSILNHEFQLAGQPEKASQFLIEPLPADASLDTVLQAMAFYLQLHQTENADALVDRLLVAARADTSAPSSGTITSGSAQSLTQQDPSFVQRHRITLLDAFVARSVKRETNARRRSTSLSDGTVQVYKLAPQGYLTSSTVKAPLSTQLMSQSTAAELVNLALATAPSDQSSVIEIPIEIIEHLERPLPGAPTYETKARQVLAAYAHWWGNRPEACYQSLIGLCEAYSDDVDLQIERARLASTLKQPRIALDTLDSFDPLDSEMLVRKEMAAMNLASELGDVGRAKQAAERLFGMRMDTSTQLALSDQLRRLGMNSQATAVLQRVRGGRQQDVGTEIQIAQAFLAGQDKSGAAEVAYTLIRRLNSGRGTQQSNTDYYLRQAVSILKSAEKLDPLIERSKRRLESAPASTRARVELAELYTAAGRTEEAETLWAEVAEKSPNDPRQMLARAQSLVKAKRYEDAANMFLDAFEKDPSLFNNGYYELTRAVQQAKSYDAMFERLCKISPNAIPYFRVDEFLRLGGSSNFSDAKRKFTLHVLQASDARSYFPQIIRSIPEQERKKMPEIEKIMIAAMCSDVAFQANSNLWSISNYSGNGVAIGVLKEMVKLLNDNDDAKSQFLQAAEKAKSEKSQTATADFLVALLHVTNPKTNSAEKTEGSDFDAKKQGMDVIRELVKRNSKNEIAPAGSQEVAINGDLLWQAGQLLENVNGIPDRAAILVDLYTLAARTTRDNSNGIEYSVESRLVDALVNNNQTADARRYLLKAYRSLDFSQQSQGNPGYGEYQELRSSFSIASKLASSNCPIDALMIYRQAMKDPSKFERAKRWGGGQTIEQFTKAADTVVGKINSVSSQEYLKYISLDLTASSSAASPVIDLLDLPIEMLDTDTKSGMLLAIDAAASSDEGKEQLSVFTKQLAEIGAERSLDWSIPATELLIAIVMDSPEIETHGQNLLSRLPKESEVTQASGTAKATTYRPLTGLYTPTMMALKSENESAKEIGGKLASYLKTLADTIAEPELQVAIASLTGGDSESLETFLASIEANHEPGQALTDRQIDSCLKIAKSSARSGDVMLSTRALKLALQSGPPLRKIADAGGGDAFSINRNRSSNEPVENPADQDLASSLCEIVDFYSDATGKKLGAREPNKEKQATATDDASMNAIADAFQSIVIPTQLPASVFPYAKMIASTTSYDQFSGGFTLTPESVSIAMAEATALSNGTDKLMESLGKRLESATDKSAVISIMVHCAFASKDQVALNQSLDAFEKSLDSVLPKEPVKGVEQVRSITSEMQRDSQQKSVVVNTVMGALWGLSTNPDTLSAEAMTRINQILSRTVLLINSDNYTASRHRSIAQQIQKKMLASAASKSDQDEFDKLLQSEKEALERQYSQYEGDYPYMRNALEQMLSELLVDGHVARLAGLIRSVESSGGKPNLNSGSAASVCLELAKLPAEQRFVALQEIALGKRDDDPILHTGTVLSYSVPPPSLRRQTPRLAEIEALTTCSKDVPMVDTMLMLADLAAELGESHSLAAKFAARSKSVGDQADIAASLVRFAGTKDAKKELDSIQPTLQAVAENIAKMIPEKTDNQLVFPTLSWYLLNRAIAAGLPKQQAQRMLEKFRMVCIRGLYTQVGAMVARVTSVTGIGAAASAQPMSPLKHFSIVSIPSLQFTDVASFQPLYRVDDEGWIVGASGEDAAILMLRYPVNGTFTVSANVREGKSIGSSDITYGGVIYALNCWDLKGRLSSLGENVVVTFPVSSIKNNEDNLESIQVSPSETIGLGNGVPFVTEQTATSFPWVGVHHRADRTVRFGELRIVGDVTIPQQVNLIDPTMRGWSRRLYGANLPDKLLPIGPEQENAAEIRAKREAYAEAIQKGIPSLVWAVKDQTLHFKSDNESQTDPFSNVSQTDPFSNRSDQQSHIQYLRPLLDGESVEFSVWWKTGEMEVHPTVGRTMLELGKDGALPSWLFGANDVNMNGYVTTDKLDPPQERLATENVPIDDAWNSIKISRHGDTIVFTLNDKPLAEFPVAESARPGIMRFQKRDVKIRSITLTGDWPSTLPENLTELVTSDEPGSTSKP